MTVFVDSNTPMYVAGRDHPLREPACRFLAQARTGAVELCTSTDVLQEILPIGVGIGTLVYGRNVYSMYDGQLLPDWQKLSA